MKGVQFTEEEKQLIVETLLFSATADICAEWTPHQTELMLEIAKKLNNRDLKLESIYLFEDEFVLNDPEVKKIIESFPNLPRQAAIVD